MPILNYTTTIPVSKTLGQVQALLVLAGARAVMAEFDDKGRPKALSFAVDMPHGRQGFTLPVHPDKVHEVLMRDRKVPTRYRSLDQAEQIAWRIIKDWTEAQLAIIQTEMVSLDQVMLTYMTAEDGRSMYQIIVGERLALGAGK
jgi:hypothetical protein